jgi:hypothetical protein
MPDPAGFPPEVLTAGVATVDGCAVLSRVKAFLTQQAVVSTLEHTVRDGSGVPVDLSAYAGRESLGPHDSFVSSGPTGAVYLRCKELVAAVPDLNPIIQSEGVFWEPSSGVVRCPLTADMVTRPGVYRLSFGIFSPNGLLVRADSALLSVEPSLWSNDPQDPTHLLGPPTLGELRMTIRDSAGRENLLLQDHEFGDDQIVDALVRPVRFFNEQPPPLRPFDTRDFPYREMWRKATVGYLFSTAASGYRRNQLPYQAGGISVDDQNKEQQYLAAAQAIDAEWRQFVLAKKIEINGKLWMGSFGSSYGSGYIL